MPHYWADNASHSVCSSERSSDDSIFPELNPLVPSTQHIYTHLPSLWWADRASFGCVRRSLSLALSVHSVCSHSAFDGISCAPPRSGEWANSAHTYIANGHIFCPDESENSFTRTLQSARIRMYGFPHLTLATMYTNRSCDGMVCVCSLLSACVVPHIYAGCAGSVEYCHSCCAHIGANSAQRPNIIGCPRSPFMYACNTYISLCSVFGYKTQKISGVFDAPPQTSRLVSTCLSYEQHRQHHVVAKGSVFFPYTFLVRIVPSVCQFIEQRQNIARSLVRYIRLFFVERLEITTHFTITIRRVRKWNKHRASSVQAHAANYIFSVRIFDVFSGTGSALNDTTLDCASCLYLALGTYIRMLIFPFRARPKSLRALLFTPISMCYWNRRHKNEIIS